MASTMRSVRRQLRKQLLSAVQAGEGHLAGLAEIADRLLGRDVGYELLIKSFITNEVGNGLAQLRTDGLIETTGRLWKASGSLQEEDVDIIAVRRLKRLKGELHSAIRLAHDHGRTEEAIAAGSMLGIIQQQLESAGVAKEEAEEAEAPALS